MERFRINEIAADLRRAFGAISSLEGSGDLPAMSPRDHLLLAGLVVVAAHVDNLSGCLAEIRDELGNISDRHA